MMCTKLITAFLLSAWLSCSTHPETASNNQSQNNIPGNVTLQSGDILFQNSQSRQCKAIELATHSNYTHCGILFMINGKPHVLEAIQPVVYTPLEDWVSRGKNGDYAAKRLKESSVLTDSVLRVLQQTGEKYLGRNYDIHFGWEDDRIYCSELVWKVYKQAAGIEVGKLHKLKDFDLSSKVVKSIMQERYGDNIPYEEPMVAPSNIFDSSILMTVVE